MRQANGSGPVAIRLRAATLQRLDELAREAGVRRATIVTDLLEEIVPKIETVDRRTLIKLRQTGDPR